MAFKKTTEIFKFEPIVQPATSVQDNKVNIPLVFTKENGKYHGFIPGIVMQDIIEDNLDACKLKLVDAVKPILKNKIANNLPFPFFPTNEEIKTDFKNVVLIKRISVTIK